MRHVTALLRSRADRKVLPAPALELYPPASGRGAFLARFVDEGLFGGGFFSERGFKLLRTSSCTQSRAPPHGSHDGRRSGELRVGDRWKLIVCDCEDHPEMSMRSRKLPFHMGNLSAEMCHSIFNEQTANNCLRFSLRSACFGVVSFFRMLAPKKSCLLYTSPSPRDLSTSRMPSSA